METDRELLELAAKAAVYDTSHRWNAYRLTLTPPVVSLCIAGVSTAWNPLADDGDALRLAVKLNIAFFPPENNEGDFAVASIAEGVLSDDGDAWIQEWVKGGDKLAATRRAIVRAAAEIGRSMP